MKNIPKNIMLLATMISNQIFASGSSNSILSSEIYTSRYLDEIYSFHQNSPFGSSNSILSREIYALRGLCESCSSQGFSFFESIRSDEIGLHEENNVVRQYGTGYGNEDLKMVISGIEISIFRNFGSPNSSQCPFPSIFREVEHFSAAEQDAVLEYFQDPRTSHFRILDFCQAKNWVYLME